MKWRSILYQINALKYFNKFSARVRMTRMKSAVDFTCSLKLPDQQNVLANRVLMKSFSLADIRSFFGAIIKIYPEHKLIDATVR